MDINEQKNLATSYNLSTKTTNELIHLLQKSIKSKFGIYSKTDKDHKYNLMGTWAQEEFDRLVSQGWDENAAKRRAIDYAKELWNRTENSIRNIPPYHIWTINKEIDAYLNEMLGYAKSADELLTKNNFSARYLDKVSRIDQSLSVSLDEDLYDIDFRVKEENSKSGIS